MNTEQKKGIEDIKGRNFVLYLSDEDVNRICSKAAEAGLMPERLLEQFIGDLVDGTYTNGSDERMYAKQWYDRCGRTYLAEKNLLTYLAREGLMEEFLDAYDLAVESERNIKQTEEDIRRGGSVSGQTGEFHPWTDFCWEEKDGIHHYGSKEEWAENQQEYIEQEQEYLEGAREELREIWGGFLKWTDRQGIDPESEIKQVLDWKEHCEPLRQGIEDEVSVFEIIAGDIREAGFIPTDTLVSRIAEFSRREKRNFTLKELVELKRANPDFSGSPEKKECFERIVKECQEQELEHMKKMPHFLKNEMIAEQLQMVSAI